MKKSILIVLLLFSLTGFGQQLKPNAKPYIEVTGKAEKEIVPDEIYIDLCLEERMEKGNKITIEEQENKLKKALSNVGIPLENLSIADINAVIVKTGWWRKELLSKAKYELKVDGANQLKKVFKVFKKLNITDANIVRATHSKIIEIRKSIRISAIKAAKDKANYLLNAIGEKTGKPLIINESIENNQQFAPLNHLNISNSNEYTSKSRTFKSYGRNVVQFEKIKISSAIYIKFEIK